MFAGDNSDFITKTATEDRDVDKEATHMAETNRS